MIYVRQEITAFTYSNIVSTVPDWSNAVITAGSFVVGRRYRIVTVGTTDFTIIGAASNTIGVTFTATGVGTGTGTAQTAYLVGDLARVGSYHYKALYGTLTTPNIDKYPLTNQGTAWYNYEVSNTYACLDAYEETKTTWAGNGIVEFARAGKEVIGIGNFTATTVTIQYLDALSVVLDTQTYTFSNNGNVYDAWDYGYAGFTSSFASVIYYPLLRKGVTVRVTFSKSGNPTDCGFMIAGKAIFMGDTIDEVSLQERPIGSRLAKRADFSTVLLQKDLARKIAEARALGEEPLMFVVDEKTTSNHQNLVILGKFTSRSGTASNFDDNVANWQIEEIVLT